MLQTTRTSRLDRLLRPRSVAIVGVSPEPGHLGGSVLANLERCRFEGDIHLVSRSRTEFNGRPCVPSIDDLPHGVDVAVLVIPQTAVIDAIAALRAARRRRRDRVRVGLRGSRRCRPRRAGEARGRGARRECRGARPELHRHVQLRCRRGAHLRVQRRASAGECAPKIGMVAQSGAMAAIMRMAFLAKGLGVTFYISTGNEADLDGEDFLERADRRRRNAGRGAVRRANPQAADVPRRWRGAPARCGKPIVVHASPGAASARASRPARTPARSRAITPSMTALLRHAAVSRGRDAGGAGRHRGAAGALQAAGRRGPASSPIRAP